MKIGIMQPYFFPYIGYFQLIKSVDKFVFYDDVNFIKNGWINRNRILINGKPSYLTVQLKNASSFKLINEIIFSDNRNKLKKSVELAYRRAPNFLNVWPVIEAGFNMNSDKISDLAITSVTEVCKYLELFPVFENSSLYYEKKAVQDKEDRIISICKQNNASTYINPIGGLNLYNKDRFKIEGINLNFIKCEEINYAQNYSSFVPWLSIIDILMFNSKPVIKNMLDRFILI